MTVQQNTISGSLHALLTGIIDYAGLFPPAALSMTETVRNYARYLHGKDQWMLARLIVPAGRLDEFETVAGEANALPDSAAAEPWRISALVAAAGDPGLGEGLRRVERFNHDHADPANGLAVINTIELRAEATGAIEGALDMLPDDLFAFFELPIEEDPRGLVTALTGSDAGAKVRTGGLKPDALPEPEHLARFIAACAAADVPFKATAGLHHPLRHHSGTVDADEFGFINVFAAAALARAGVSDLAVLREVLVETSIEPFEFAADRLTCCGHVLPLDLIEDVRQSFAISYGSCSFEEPLEDLRTLNLL